MDLALIACIVAGLALLLAAAAWLQLMRGSSSGDAIVLPDSATELELLKRELQELRDIVRGGAAPDDSPIPSPISSPKKTRKERPRRRSSDSCLQEPPVTEQSPVEMHSAPPGAQPRKERNLPPLPANEKPKRELTESEKEIEAALNKRFTVPGQQQQPPRPQNASRPTKVVASPDESRPDTPATASWNSASWN